VLKILCVIPSGNHTLVVAGLTLSGYLSRLCPHPLAHAQASNASV